LNLSLVNFFKVLVQMH